MASKTIIIPEVILAFTQNLFTPGLPPSAGPDAQKRWSCQFLVDADSPQKKLIDDAIQEIAEREWKDKAKFTLSSIEGNSNKMCFIDGNKRDPSKYAGYAGRWGLSANRKLKDGPPGTVDKAKNPVGEASGLLYSGAIVNAKVDLFTYDTPSRGIACGLVVVQFRKHGQAFGGASAVHVDDMEDLSFEDDEEDASPMI